MADFCKQCSISVFGEDFGDLHNLGGRDAKPLEDGYGYPALCEGCGPTLTKEDGTCISVQCSKKHGDTSITSQAS